MGMPGEGDGVTRGFQSVTGGQAFPSIAPHTTCTHGSLPEGPIHLTFVLEDITDRIAQIPTNPFIINFKYVSVEGAGQAHLRAGSHGDHSIGSCGVTGIWEAPSVGSGNQT